MKKIMILGAGILQLPAIIQAKKMGLQTFAVDIDRDAVGFAHADVCLPVSTTDIPYVVEEAKRCKLDGIMTLASDMPIRTVAAVSKALDIPGISEETALNATNKARMRECLKAHRVPIPEFVSADSYEDYLLAIHRLGGNCIVKPVDNSGSRGVIFVGNQSDKNDVDHAFCYSKKNSKSGQIIIEEYMSGPEISVETLSVDGVVHIIAVTDKLTSGVPEFVEMGHSQPTCISDGETIRSTAAAAAKAIGVKEGPAHIEMIITNEGPKVVEIGARLGGDHITTELVPLSTGIDMVGCCIQLALGRRPDFEKKYDKGAAIRYFDVPAGKIRGIDGMKESKAMPGVKQINLSKGIGDTVGEVCDSTDRIGYVIAGGRDADEAVTVCETVLRKVKFKMEQL